MKTLKLNHEFAQLVRDGKRTSTLRLHDDKELAVNDELELVDKVDPQDPVTWRVIGVARINKIVQKRLGDVRPEEREGHENLAPEGALIETYGQYYGVGVSSETPVKIIHFSFMPREARYVDSAAKITTSIKEAKLYADGGSRGNPGPSASGFVILTMGGEVVVKKGIYLGITTNNQAEYRALKFGLEEAERLQIPRLHVYMDSLLVVNQLLGIFKVKNRDLWPIHASIKELLGNFSKVTFAHIPRELNKAADHAVNEALDKALR